MVEPQAHSAQAKQQRPHNGGAYRQGSRSTYGKTLKIEGMMCDHCVMHVQKALAAIPGVQVVIVSLENKSAKVTIDPIVADETLRNAIEEAGYVLNEIL